MGELLVIRHAVTALNDAGRYQGWSDPPLTREGERQARGLGRRVREDGAAPGIVWASDLTRARRTAELAFPGAELHPDPRLRELRFGVLEGRTHGECLERVGAPYRRWLRDPDASPPPGGETMGRLRRRLAAWLDDLPASGPATVVTHAGPVAVLLARLRGLPPRWHVERSLRPAPASVIRAGRDGRTEGGR